MPGLLVGQYGVWRPKVLIYVPEESVHRLGSEESRRRKDQPVLSVRREDVRSGLFGMFGYEPAKAGNSE